MRHRRILLVGLLTVGLLAGGFVASGFLDGSAAPEHRTPPDARLYQPEETGSYLWPYTSRSRSVDGRTLAINVVVRGDRGTIRRALERRSEANWTVINETEGNESEARLDDGPPVQVGKSPWHPARGSSRYTYVTADPNASGRWVESSYQLATGTYLGHRTHIRAYPGPFGNWTAFQAHTEYWDWFRLRHTVTGVAPGARFVERDLRDEPFVGSVSREYHGLGGGGSDGWLTVIDFASTGLIVGVAFPRSSRRRWNLSDAALPVSLAGLVVGVRTAGITAEQAMPGVTPKLFAAVLYPTLVFGLPALATYFARGRPPTRTALVAAAGLGAGFVLDLSGVGISTVPVSLVLHRFTLMGSIGLLAYGVARDDGRLTALGVSAWFVTLAASLFGYV
ncbi:hypothetical protein [Halopelagius longus]|uniref:Uncharacterized protein n=1 Tax=Halopelagius longus TaxID=1236180 RepID=A0A1H1G706_9EURY|nr:hypothetical protein [Halopelagius longus]SDR09034.1 hypothetical protein SAMN05216278_3565 [Halopelagius longus]